MATVADKKEIKKYFKVLRKKGIRVEDVASRLKISFSAVRGWSDGRTAPRFLARKYLEQVYGIKISGPEINGTESA